MGVGILVEKREVPEVHYCNHITLYLTHLTAGVNRTYNSNGDSTDCIYFKIMP